MKNYFMNHLNSQCSPGFTGPMCNQSVSTCYPNPCLNNGTCLVGANSSFMCLCSSNYFGNNCEMTSSKKFKAKLS